MTAIINEPEQTKYQVGDMVRKRGSKLPGELVGVFRKRSGAVRYVMEDDRGGLHVLSTLDVEPR